MWAYQSAPKFLGCRMLGQLQLLGGSPGKAFSGVVGVSSLSQSRNGYKMELCLTDFWALQPPPQLFPAKITQERPQGPRSAGCPGATERFPPPRKVSQ